MNNRQKHILFAIIEEYVESAQPVSSGLIAKKYNFGVSPATVRNDMASLEDLGFLRQPHTSAGRVPTEKSYRLYLHECKRAQKALCTGQLEQVLRKARNPRELTREIAKSLVELSGETAIMSLDTGWSHYTGIANLFQKPDFGKNLVQALWESAGNLAENFFGSYRAK